MAKIKNILKNKYFLLILGIIILIIIILVIFLKETPNELQNDSNDESIKEEINYYTVTFDSSIFIPLLTSGTSTALSIDWNEGATTIIIINNTKKISVNGVIFISVNNCCFFLFVNAIFFT